MPVPFVPAPHVLQANILFDLAGQRVEIVLNFDYGSSVFADAASDCYNLLQSQWWTEIRDGVSSDLSHVGVYMVDLTTNTGPVSSRGPWASPLGGDGRPAASNGDALVVTHRTAKRGKSFRGRSFMPGIPKAEFTDSRWSSGATGNAVAAFNNLRTEAIDVGLPMVIVSRKENGVYRTTAAVTPIISCVIVSDTVKSQRRRTPGVGR